MGPSSILQTVLALAVCFSTSVASDTNDSYCLRTEAGSSLHDALSIVYRIANVRGTWDITTLYSWITRCI